MYDEDKIINEEEITEKNNTIEIINDKLERDKFEALQRENQTLKQMVENRNQEIKKEPTQDKIQVLASALGIDKINERLDELNKNDNYLVAEMSKVVNAINQIGQTISGGQAIPQGEAPAIGDPLQKMELLSNLFDKGLQLYTTYKQNKDPVAQAPLIDQNFINQRMVESFMEDLDTGKSISTFIKSSLKKTATKNIVNTALKDIGQDTNEPA